jgi:phenylpropionate dioxygenase-like ring-hydroxylating dioxygenase large terminal subunit
MRVPTPGTARWLLPPEAYWSREWFAREQERLFGRCWILVGTVADVDAAGLVGAVAGRTVHVTCPTEHGPLSGRTIPGGKPIAVDTWGCYVFVHLDPESAPTLTEWLGDVPERVGTFRPEQLVEVARHRFELRANWKWFVENHVDVYHLWYLHADSLGAYDHPRARWQMTGPHWTFYEPPRAGLDTRDERFWRGLLPISHVGEERWGSGAHLVFPNMTFATGAGFFMTYQVVPLTADRSLVDMRLRTEPGSDPAASMALSRRIIEGEDGAACEALQNAVRSPGFAVGPLARHHELPITRFHEGVLEVMR